MKFLRTSLLLSAISFVFLAKAQEISPSFYKYHPLPPTPDTFVATEMITIPDGIQSITKDEKTGQVTVTDTKGVKHVLPQGKDVAVADENGRGALVDKHGQITNTTAEQAKAAAKREYGFSIVFEKATESKAGFDTYDKKTTALKNTYETIDQYHVPWKAIGTSADAVKGSINFGTAKDLVFEQDGAKLTYNEFSNILTVNPAAAGSTAHVIVKEKTGDKEKIRGKLNVVGYTPITKIVHIVPVNNATATLTATEIQTYLNDVYAQALTSWTVTTENKIAISLTGDFDDGASGLLSTYTADMRKVIKSYGKLENDQYYLFLIESGKNKTGYMPRSKRAGFIFLNNQNAEDLKHTIAHELGHGAFTLRHPFAEYPAVTAKSTDNLMDYAGGTHLYKWQWDQIHNPAAVIGLFEGDSEGEFSLPCLGWFDDCDDVLKMLKKIKNACKKGEKMTIKGVKKDSKEYYLRAMDVAVNGEGYSSISIINNTNEENKTFEFDPQVYKEYSLEGESKPRYLDFYNNNKLVFRIVVYGKDEAVGFEKLKQYLFEDKKGKPMFFHKPELTARQIAEARTWIKSLKDESERKKYFLELQKKVPYYSQQDNYTDKERSCNVTALAMNLNFLGKEIDGKRLPDELLVISKNKNITNPETWAFLAEKFSIKSRRIDIDEYNLLSKSEKKKLLLDNIKQELESGNSISLSLYPQCKGHIVRVQELTEKGLVIDDPNGKCPIDCIEARENCEKKSYENHGDKNRKDHYGKDLFYSWELIEKITVKYMIIFYE